MRKIREVCDVIPGYAFKSNDLVDDGIPVIKIGNIEADGSIDIYNTQRLPPELLEERHLKYQLKDGDILIAMTGATAGKTGRINCPDERVLLLNQRVAHLKPTKINGDFLWAITSTNQYRMIFSGLGGGAAQPNMSGGQIESVEIPVPYESVQFRIAEILSAYDDLIENNRRRMELLEASARHLYEEWFVRLRFPGHEHTEITNGVPEGWERKSLGDCFVLKRGHDLPENHRVPGEFPVVSSSGITGYHNHKKANGPGVVTGRYGTLGEVHYIETDYWPHNTALYVVDFKGNSPRIVCCCLRNELQKVKSQSNNAAVPGVNRNVIHTFKLLWPSSKLLAHFDDLLIPIYQQLRNLRQQNEKLKSARDLLLPRLVSGEVPV
jgi:type I restriction enzyme S subunit